MKPVQILLTTFCFVLFFSTSRAQIGKGQIMLGGAATLSVNDDEGTSSSLKITRYALKPEAGFGIGKNWIIGGSLGYGHIKQEHEGTSNLKTNQDTYSVGVLARKFHPFTNQFGLYAQANVEYGFGNGNIYDHGLFIDPVYADINFFAANIQPGLYFNPGKKIVLEATFGVLGYSRMKYDYTSPAYPDGDSKDFEVSVTNGLSLGFKIIL